VVYILQRSGQTEQPNPCTVQRVENHGKPLNTCTYFVVRLQCFSLDTPPHNSKTQFQRNPHTSSRGMLYCKILQAEPQSVDRGGGSDSDKPKLLLRNHSLLTRLVQSRLTVKDQMAPRNGTTTRRYFSPQLSRSKCASHCLAIRQKERPDVLSIHMDAESHNLAVQKKLCRDTTWYWRLDTIQAI